MDTAELPLTGYLDRFSHRPGERFTAHVSLRDGGEYRARLVRVHCADPNPEGPGWRMEDLSAVFDRRVQGRRQGVHIGSYGIVEHGPARDAELPCTWAVLARIGEPGMTGTLIAEEGGGRRVALRLAADGVEGEIAGPSGAARLRGPALEARRWYRLWLAADPESGRVVLGQRAVDDAPAIVEAEAEVALPARGAVLFAAANAEAPRDHFTGKLEAPVILQGFVAEWPAALDMPAAKQLAAWDFSIGISSRVLTDTGLQQCHGRVVNTPTRAMAGARWSGAEMCWRHAPADYAAIHFSSVDLADCRWEADFSWTVPADLRSGAYALHLTSEAGEDWLPLYVLPPREGPHAKLAFLAATFTYQAYANHSRGNADAAYKARVDAWNAAPANPDDFPIYGRSTYNLHADGTGIAFSTRRRPVLTMRPGFLTFNDPKGSGLRHYPADTHILAWLEAKGIAFDVITDEDLDEEGVGLLEPYRAVFTGSHPEYHTLNTLDALQGFVDGGGNLAYLGGNGFYWRIARDPEAADMIELRRAEGGIRAWAAEAGEYYHATDGQYGGLWKRNRRPPQMLAGVGFSGQGLFEGSYYRRLPASYSAEYAWMFAGIEGDIIGDYGLSGGAAAGFEVDRADVQQGTPANAVILARSENLPASFVTPPEEMLNHVFAIDGEKVAEVCRGEIVHFTTPAGGEVFAVGSITFCGSLWRDGAFDGPISRLLENVARRFTAP